MLLRLLFLSLALCVSCQAQKLSALADKPDWTKLDGYQETITREEFTRLLHTVYAPGDAAKNLIEIGADSALIRTTLVPATDYRLHFAKDSASAKPMPNFWRAPASLGPAPDGKPLAGMKIALDPGHLGGPWARMEERFFQIGDALPVTEGDMTLRVAAHLAPQLEALGAEVVHVRRTTEPVTEMRPATLRDVARGELARLGIHDPRETYDPTILSDPTRSQTIQWQSEILFYRYSEIRRRAALVNEQLRPDLVLCLHFNAEGWGDDPLHPIFVPRNHLHMLVNGCYSPFELRNDDVRFEMLLKLLSRSYPIELAASERAASAFAQASGLPPYIYTTGNAFHIGDTRYVWARNLLANRLYRAPTLYYEPYVMNNQDAYDRIQLGDYEGEKEVAGTMRRSIYREYADAVTTGLRDYFISIRPTRP